MFLGSGSAFSSGADNFQSNMLLHGEGCDRTMLIDAGTDLPRSLAAAGHNHRDINDLYISHLHADHTGGLEYLGFSTHFDPMCERPRLFISESLVEPLWENTLRGGMGHVSNEETTLETFFDVHPLPERGSFEWCGHHVQLVPTIHVRGANRIVHSHGLQIIDERSTLITTDTRYEPEHLQQPLQSSDLIFHDCETTPFRTGVHAHYDELCQLPAETRAKMWLYHYQTGELPDARADGFLGFVRCGQVFDLT